MANENSVQQAVEKKRGRPKRNPIDSLRAQLYLHVVCLAAGIKGTGYQLEQHFEPEKIIRSERDNTVQRGCKWDRYIRGTVTPSIQTQRLIEGRYPGTQQFLTNPLWLAMKAGEQTEEYWQLFYNCLRLSLQNKMFQGQSKNELIFKKKNYLLKALDPIAREGDTEALASLIAILRKYKSKRFTLDYHCIEVRVINLMWDTFCEEPYFNFRHAIFEYLREHIVHNDKRIEYMPQSPWNLTYTQVENSVMSLKIVTSLAASLLLFTDRKEMREFLYWLRKGNVEEITLDLAEAHRNGFLNVKQSLRGLSWLLSKLNSTRPMSKQITNPLRRHF
ncbi:hypothetical protein [Shewanella maritima]|uniref:hypothetical protein n=1 Tax=Shewanella maritima TaxID=2520507 RepID=UPI003735E62C